MVSHRKPQLETAARPALDGGLGESRRIGEVAVVEDIIDVQSTRLQVESAEVLAQVVRFRIVATEEVFEVGKAEVVARLAVIQVETQL